MIRPGVPTTMSAPLDTSRICCWMGTPALKNVLETMALSLSLHIHHSARYTNLALSLSPDIHHSARYANPALSLSPNIHHLAPHTK